MSDTPRDQGWDPDRAGTEADAADSDATAAAAAAKPTTGPPGGAVAASAVDLSATDAGAGTKTAGAGAGTTAGSPPGPATASSTSTSTPTSPSPSPGTTTSGRSRAARLSPTGPEADARKRRRRRWLIGGIAAGAALLVIALCAGGLAVVSAVADVREDASDAREDRRLRDTACLELEQRLNRLAPPGAATSPQGRAVAVRDENAATRIYVGQLRDRRTSDGWRQLIDARTAYAEGLDTQARSRTPAFFVAPRTDAGPAVADELVELSPAACAGPIRRLAAPDL